MTCDQAELRMAELLAGEIAPEDRSALEKHLLDCATCRADFELARAGARIEWADVSVPREVIESTLASFREPTPVARLLRWATAAAAVFGVVALLLSSSRAQKPAEEPIAAACTFERPQVLATMQEAVVGALVCKDEEGRPVGELGLKSHDVSVEILDGIAKTTVEENFENHTDRRLEGTFHFPLPSDASISRLALEVNGKIEEGTCLERERAREVFESIVRKMQDPALLEWQPGGLFKCRVFPIEPRSTKRVIVAYTQALPCFQGKMTYVYPLASEKTRTHPPGEASIAVQARFSGGLARIASPSHHLEVQRKDANEASMAFRAANYRPNNDFVVTMEPGEEEVRVVSHKTDGDDGYFACFATPKGGGARVPTRYGIVLDVSASISAPRLEVAKRLVRAMMERRIEGDRFEILAHNIEVERSGEVDLRAANDFMDRLQPIGGSDVLKALIEARCGEIIYIGKGAATFGETETSKILETVKGLRIRTIAVGSDANGTLLERLGGMMRVNPNDDVTKRVEEIAATLGSPVLSDVKIEGGDAVYDVVGVRDLFYGERLVVSGRYRGPTAKLVITGSGYRREVDVAFPAKEEGNNYVRRLWAQRKVSDLLAQGPAKKPEVTELGVKYQIMTPYTSFLVLETEQMWKDFQLKREVQKQDEVLGKKMAESGEASSENIAAMREMTRKMAHLLELAYMAADQKKFDRVIQLSDELLKIDPHYEVAKELKEDAEKSRHKEEYSSVWARKLDVLKQQTDDDRQPRIPRANTVRFQTPEEWKETLKTLTVSVIRTEGQPAEGKLEQPHPVEPVKPTDPAPRVAVDPRAGPIASIPGPRPVAPKPRIGKSTDLPTVELSVPAEDPKARAIREAYEEQLRRDRQEVVLNLKNGGNDQIVEEFRRQTGWNIIVDKEQPDYSKFMKEALVRTPTNQSGGLEFVLDGVEGQLGARWGNLPPRVVEGLMKGERIETYSIQPFERWDGSKGVPYADFTLDFDGYLVLPTQGGGGPLTGATWWVDNGVEIIEESRAKLSKSLIRKSLIENSEQRRLLEELGKLEETTVELSRDKKFLEEKLNAISQAGGNVNVAPKKALEAKITAVANEIGLVVFSIGKDDGVLEGDEFTVYRGGDFVAKVVVDRSDRKWSAGKVVWKKTDPRVADDVSNHIFAVGPAACASALDVIQVDDDGGIRLNPTGSGAMAQQIFAVTRAGKFVAMIRVERVSASQVDARVWQNLAVGRILPGDRAELVPHPKGYLAALPEPVRMDLSSRANQQTIRAKMGLKQ